MTNNRQINSALGHIKEHLKELRKDENIRIHCNVLIGMINNLLKSEAKRKRYDDDRSINIECPNCKSRYNITRENDTVFYHPDTG